jgi:hypothetical protein
MFRSWATVARRKGDKPMQEPKNFNEMHFAFEWGLDVARGADKHMPGKDGNRALKNAREEAHFAYGLFIGSRDL